ncbi:unnamed protein product, partial [Rotaria sp. Silwood2]
CEKHKQIDNFERNYSPENAIQWYTKESFFYKDLNKALRNKNYNEMLLFGPYIADIHLQLEKNRCKNTLKVYRGQIMSKFEISKLKRFCRQLISVNSFLSTSLDKAYAEIYKSDHLIDGQESVLFEIDANPQMAPTKPFAKISELSNFPNELEVLFTAGTIFRLEDMNNNNGLWNIKMTLYNEDDDERQKVFMYTKKRIDSEQRNHSTLGKLLLNMGECSAAKLCFIRFLNELAENDPQRLDLYQDLADLEHRESETKKALQWLEKREELQKQIVSTSIDPNKHVTTSIDTMEKSINQIKQSMIQMQQLNNFTTPRCFFILPAKDCSSELINNENNWLKIHYKLYFLCECSNEPNEMHIAPHHGYLIRKPIEFIGRYGSCLRITSRIVQLLLSFTVIGTEWSQNSLKFLSSLSSIKPNTPEYHQSIERQFELVNALIEKYHKPSIDQEESASISHINFSVLETYLDLVDNNCTLGNLYRKIIEKTNVCWQCEEHYDKIHFTNQLAEHVSNFIKIKGRFKTNNKEAYINGKKFNHQNVQTLCNALQGLNIIKLTFIDCSFIETDLETLLNTVLNHSTIRHLEMVSIRIIETRLEMVYLRIIEFLGSLIPIESNTCQTMIIESINQTLKVRFSGTFENENIPMIIRILSQNEIHKKLDISMYDFLGHGNELQECLKKHETMTNLIVTYCNSVDLLNPIFCLNITSLNQLKLTHLVISPSFSSHFCELLKKDRRFRDIDLMDTFGFQDENFICDLLDIFKDHWSIENVSLHLHDIQPDTKKETYLIKSLKDSNFISHLRISASIISHKLIETFIKAVEKHRLTHLEFYNSHLSDAEIMKPQWLQLQCLHDNGFLFKLVWSDKIYWHKMFDQKDEQQENGKTYFMISFIV